jgi:hypothetical protein
MSIERRWNDEWEGKIEIIGEEHSELPHETALGLNPVTARLEVKVYTWHEWWKREMHTQF